MNTNTISRRKILKTVGGSLAVAGGIGVSSGSVTAQTCDRTLSLVDLGDVCVGECASESQSATLSDLANGIEFSSVEVVSIRVTGPDADQFTVDSNVSEGSVVSPDQQLTGTVTYCPTSTGNAEAQVVTDLNVTTGLGTVSATACRPVTGTGVDCTDEDDSDGNGEADGPEEPEDSDETDGPDDPDEPDDTTDEDDETEPPTNGESGEDGTDATEIIEETNVNTDQETDVTTGFDDADPDTETDVDVPDPDIDTDVEIPQPDIDIPDLDIDIDLSDLLE